VFGTALNSKLVAIVVLADGVEASDQVKKELSKTGREAGLVGFEVPGAFALKKDLFSIESGVLTATSKIVRGVAKEFFKEDIVAMYKGLGEEVKV
jgi:hypothetical protein